LITDSNIGYLIIAGVLYAYLISEEVRQTRYNPRMENEKVFFALYDDWDKFLKISMGDSEEKVKKFINSLYPTEIMEIYIGNNKNRIIEKVNDSFFNTWIEYSDPWAEIKDSITDLNQYASCFIVPLWAYGAYWWAAGLLGVILTVYVITIKWCKP
jgi:hypothetical protein